MVIGGPGPNTQHARAIRVFLLSLKSLDPRCAHGVLHEMGRHLDISRAP